MFPYSTPNLSVREILDGFDFQTTSLNSLRGLTLWDASSVQSVIPLSGNIQVSTTFNGKFPFDPANQTEFFYSSGAITIPINVVRFTIQVIGGAGGGGGGGGGAAAGAQAAARRRSSLGGWQSPLAAERRSSLGGAPQAAAAWLPPRAPPPRSRPC